MILDAISAVYAAAVATRRRWYAGNPARQKRLRRPVISLGNLRVGGSGKTPLAAHVARLLLDAGERPAILSRGYRRRVAAEGVTVVSDGTHVLADVESAGDEPLMLARSLPAVPVLVSADRYLAGTLAEAQLGVTVHVLDDGFQHLALARDIDVLLVDVEDLADRPLPAGRLREPISAASVADAVIVSGVDQLEPVRRRLGVARTFSLKRRLGAARFPDGRPLAPAAVVAVAGIARPQRFFDDLRAAGWVVAEALAFPDHHWFTSGDVDRMMKACAESGAPLVLTTEKDAVRLERLASDLAYAAIPLAVEIEPSDEFNQWMLSRLQTSSAAGGRR